TTEESDRDRRRWEQQAEQAREQSQRQADELQAAVERLSQESGERQRDHAAALERAEGLEKNLDALRGSHGELQRELEETHGHFERDRATLAAAADEASRQAATYREERDAALRWQTESARLSDELDALNRRHADLRRDAEKAR